MQKVLTAAEMREVDRLTTERYGIPSIILMENAAHAVARVITEKLGGSVKGKSILILCGKGNNGGDGAALARILWKDGAQVVPLLFGQIDQVMGDARVNLEALLRIDEDVATSGGELNKLLVHCDDEDLVPLTEWFLNESEPKVIVDALFGTGLKNSLKDRFVDVVQLLENNKPTIISIDLPSGLDADASESIGRNVSATITVTLTAPKVANVVAPASSFNGELIIANIGSPQGLIVEQPSQLYLAELCDAAEWLKRTKISSDSYKNKRGHLLVVAGSENYSGAAVLSANAAMRSGVGLVTLIAPKSSKVSVESRVLPEVIVRGAAETEDGAISEKAFDELGDLVSKADAVAIGSGMSQGTGVNDFVRRAVKEFRQPLILDADALNALAPFAANWQPAYAGGSDIILTPHEGEFLRLLGTDDKDAIKDRVSAVRDLSQKHNVILVLKGERVLIGEPGGRVVVNPTGNSGLGKAGNGDTLAGILAGFVAQAAKMNIDIFETVVAAVYVAGMAGDVAEKKFGKRVMTASDVRECLSDTFAEIENI